MFEAERGRLRTHAQRVDELGAARRRALGRRAGARRATAAPRARARWRPSAGTARSRTAASASRATSAGSATWRGRAWPSAAARLGRLAGKLDSLSPLAVLSRGYALVWDEHGRLLREPAGRAPSATRCASAWQRAS